MRNPRTKLTRSKIYRRTTLFLMVVTASVSIARERREPEMRVLPPLPLIPIDARRSGEHPFCHQENVALSNHDASRWGNVSHSTNEAIRIRELPTQLDFRAIAQSRTIKSLTPIDLKPNEAKELFECFQIDACRTLERRKSIERFIKPTAAVTVIDKAFQCSLDSQVSNVFAEDDTIDTNIFLAYSPR